MKNLKQELSDEISKGKRKKVLGKDVITLFVVFMLNTGLLCAGYLLGTKGLKVWLIGSIVVLFITILSISFTSVWKKKDPTHEEIKALAQKKIGEMDVAEDITGDMDEEKRQQLKNI